MVNILYYSDNDLKVQVFEQIFSKEKVPHCIIPQSNLNKALRIAKSLEDSLTLIILDHPKPVQMARDLLNNGYIGKLAFHETVLIHPKDRRIFDYWIKQNNIEWPYPIIDFVKDYF